MYMPEYYWSELRSALTLSEFEPQSRRDYALIPWSIARWFFAWLLTLPRTPLLKINWRIRERYWSLFLITRYVLPLHMGRHSDTTPVICGRCLWAGARRWLVHTYTGGWDSGDVEACDECPRCGAEL